MTRPPAADGRPAFAWGVSLWSGENTCVLAPRGRGSGALPEAVLPRAAHSDVHAGADLSILRRDRTGVDPLRIDDQHDSDARLDVWILSSA